MASSISGPTFPRHGLGAEQHMADRFQELIKGPLPVVVDFTATWCGPCKAMAPILHQFKQEVGEAAVVIKVDVDANPAAAQHYQVQGVPTLMIFKNGGVVWRRSGVVSSTDLQAALKPFLI